MLNKSGKSRIFANTMFLYGRMVVTVFLALFSTRIVFDSLGTVDFGIFSLVGGLIAFLAFFQGALTTSTQRHFCVAYGAANSSLSTFSSLWLNTVRVHIVVAASLVLLLEILGLLFLPVLLNFPAERMHAVWTVFHFSVFTLGWTIAAVPYDAIINANEDFYIEALISILEAILRLLLASYLIYTGFDKLQTFAVGSFLVAVLARFVKIGFCRYRYKELGNVINQEWDYNNMRAQFSFMGWNVVGALCAVARSQGSAIILNRFFGIEINASTGLSNQINAHTSYFSVSLMKAFQPQIMKAAGRKDTILLQGLALQSSRISAFLLATLIAPLMIEMEWILTQWLSNPPKYSADFARLVLLTTFFNQTTNGLQTAIQGVGNIKYYQLVVGGLILLGLPLGLILLILGCPPQSIFIGYVFIELVACMLRIQFAHFHCGINRSAAIANLGRPILYFSALLGGIYLTQLALPHINSNVVHGFTILIITAFWVVLLFPLALLKNERRSLHRHVKQILNKGHSGL